MFANLKTRNNQSSVFNNVPPINSAFCRSPGATSSLIKHNEADRLVRCRICGWICDRERDIRIKDGSFAGDSVALGSQKTAGASIGDAMIPTAGTVTRTPDKYYDITIKGGCPACGSYLYDPAMPIIKIP